MNANQTTGVYWCDAILDGKTTTRYFRIFVTSDEEDDDRPHNNLVPRIKNAVEYLIFPSGSSFQLKCQIAIDESRNYNLTWSVPSKPTKHLNYSITWETVGNLRSAILKASDIRFLDTGNYTCHRSDALHLVASQYIFVSGILLISIFMLFNSVLLYKCTLDGSCVTCFFEKTLGLLTLVYPC